MDNNQEKFKSGAKPLLDKYTDRLLQELELLKIITLNDNSYSFSSIQSPEQSKSTPIKDIFSQLFEFRNIILGVYRNLYSFENSQNLQLSQVIAKLVEQGAFPAPWMNRKDVHDILDKLDSLYGDDLKIKGGVEKILIENKINLNKIILQSLEFYGQQVALNYFQDYNYVRKTDPVVKQVDLQLVHKTNIYPTLLFEFKYRKRSSLPNSDLLLKALRIIEELTNFDHNISYFFLVVFTDQNDDTFDKIKFQFEQDLREIKQYDQFHDRIRFLPVSITAMKNIDDELQKFKDFYIEQNIQFEFRNQNPPKTRPERNDHFFERTFEFKKCQFEIKINPVSTQYWRFGLKFAETEKFPPITIDRHEDENNADIHIIVGDLNYVNNLPVWQKPNQLGLAVYHADVLSEAPNGITLYQGEPVVLTITSNSDGSNVEFQIKTMSGEIHQVFNLSKFNFCRIHAWSDYSKFLLSTEMKIIQKGLQEIIFLENFKTTTHFWVNFGNSNNPNKTNRVENGQMVFEASSKDWENGNGGAYYDIESGIQSQYVYVVSCRAKSTANTTMQLRLWLHDTKGNGSQTSNWQIPPNSHFKRYERTFTATEFEALRIHLHCKGGSGQIIVNEVRVTKQQPNVA